MKKILITGSNGFLGKKIASRLTSENYKVIGFDKVDKNNSMEYKFIKGNFLDLEVVKKALSDVDLCIHAGAVSNLNYAKNNFLKTIDVNVKGAGNVAKVCEKYDIPLVYISSCCVYGSTNSYPTAEGDKKNPVEIYGCTKFAGEQIVRGLKNTSNLDATILRYSTVYGPGMRPSLAIYIFLKNAIEGRTLQIHGSGKQTRSFIYIEDLIDATMNVIERDIRGEVINIAGGEEISIYELSKKVLDLTGRDFQENIEFVEDRPGQIMKENIDISKAKKLLNWKPKIDIDKGLKLTYDWLKQRL